METAQYILTILKSELMILFSWGARNFRALPNGLIFTVNGYLHKGEVKVLYLEGSDDFIIQLLGQNNKLIRAITSVYFDELVAVIDQAIEHTDDYEERVKEQYRLY